MFYHPQISISPPIVFPTSVANFHIFQLSFREEKEKFEKLISPQNEN